MSEVVLKAQGIAKTYAEGSLRTDVLRNVPFTLDRGKTMAIIGASGTGKRDRKSVV